MAQNINIERISESGEILSSSNCNVAEIVNVLWEIHDFKVNYPWLSTIDPYGLTYINHPQKQLFLEEIAKLALATESSQARDILDSFRSFIMETETHQYVRLTGD
jgi:hypothetical protein